MPEGLPPKAGARKGLRKLILRAYGSLPSTEYKDPCNESSRAYHLFFDLCDEAQLYKGNWSKRWTLFNRGVMTKKGKR